MTGWGWGGVGWGMDPIKHLDFIGLFYYLNVPAHEQGCRGESQQQSTPESEEEEGEEPRR